MRVNVFYIQKKRGDFEEIEQNYAKLIQNYADFKLVNVFNKAIAKAQEKDAESAKNEYAKAFLPHKKTYSIALSEHAKAVDSYKFAQVLQDKSEINFFIAGAYGFSKEFVANCDYALSLSPLTFSHELARCVLLEQIYRGFCINNKHPYHK